MEKIIQVWTPVLKKCYEFSEDEYQGLAQLLNNQFSLYEDAADFSKFALPMCRFIYRKLLDSSIKVEILENNYSTMEWPIGNFDGVDPRRWDNPYRFMDHVAVILSNNIISDFPDGVKIFTLIIPHEHISGVYNPGDVIMRVLNE